MSFLRECFWYDVETGALTWQVRPQAHFRTRAVWRRWNAKYAASAAGIRNAQGYRNLTLRYGGKCHKPYVHRICWALHYGEYPTQTIDHINHDRSDNRIANLRDVSHRENMINRKWRPMRQGEAA